MKQTTHNALTAGKVVLARLRFVAVFVVAALIVGYWDNLKNHVDKWTRPPVAPDALAGSAAGEVEYYCPMHPDVVRSEPGHCPKCGMPLVKRKKGEAVTLPADVLARVQLTPQRLELANVHTTPVGYRALEREVRAPGVLDYDERKLARLSARVAGRADELYVTYTGQEVKRGDPIYSLYSPEVYTAQREYLSARKRVNELPPNANADSKADATALYNASLEKLVLWGVTQEHLDRLDEEFDHTGKVPDHLTVTAPIGGIVVRKDINQGQYVQVGDAPYTVADLRGLWLQLKLYEGDVPLVQTGQAAELKVEALPAETFRGAVTFTAYQLDPQTRTLDARVEVPNPDLRLRPGMFASAVVRVPLTPAVLGASTRPAGADATTRSATQPQGQVPGEPQADPLAAYGAALRSYFKAHDLLAADKADGVAALIADSAKELEPARQAPAVAPGYRRLLDAAAASKGQRLDGLRQTFKEVSAAMIELGRAIGTPPEGPAVKVFRCPMKKANWLQGGTKTANPYYGSEMFDCGSAIETLPKADRKAAAPTAPSGGGAARMLAVPRSAVIDTGSNKVVYAQSAPGVFDMKSVKLGPAAGEYYPVLSGLEEGEPVVTVGTFLIDAENRLNPMRLAEAPAVDAPAADAPAQGPASGASHAGHQH